MVGPPSDKNQMAAIFFCRGGMMRTYLQVLKEEKGLFITFGVLILLGLGCVVFAVIK